MKGQTLANNFGPNRKTFFLDETSKKNRWQHDERDEWKYMSLVFGKSRNKNSQHDRNDGEQPNDHKQH